MRLSLILVVAVMIAVEVSSVHGKLTKEERKEQRRALKREIWELMGHNPLKPRFGLRLFQRIKEFLENIDNEVEECETEGLEQEIADLQTQLNGKDAEIATLQAQLTSKTEEAEALQVQINTLDEEVSSLQGQVSAKDGEIATLQSQISEKDAQIANLQNELNICQGQSGEPECSGCSCVLGEAGGYQCAAEPCTATTPPPPPI